MSCLLVNLGLSNLGSIRRRLELCGAQDVVVHKSPPDAYFERIVLPGVGSFPAAMAHLTSCGWIPYLEQAVMRGTPLLGICLGMHLLADFGFENNQKTQGLGFVPGEVVRLDPHPNEKVPHVGWNEVNLARECGVFDAIGDRTDFYFCHSYHFRAHDQKMVSATTPYCGEINSIVSANNIFGVQFHPEKSSKAGFTLLEKFLLL